MSRYTAIRSRPSSSRRSTSGGRSRTGRKKKKEHHGGGEDRDFLAEGRQALALMHEAYPQLAALQEQYGPRFARAEVAAAAARGEGELQAVEKYGPQVREALLAANPSLRATTGRLDAEVAATGPSEIEKELQQRTLADLRLGGQINAAEADAVAQSTRAAYLSRGLGHGSPAAMAEVMNRAHYATSREQQRRAQASAVDAQVQQRQASDRSFLLNNANWQGAYFDPYSRLGFAGGGGSAATGQTQGPGTFAPYLSASGDVGRSNQQAALERSRMALQERMFREGQDFSRWQTEFTADAQYQNALMNRDAYASAQRGARKDAMTGSAISGATTLAMAAMFF